MCLIESLVKAQIVSQRRSTIFSNVANTSLQKPSLSDYDYDNEYELDKPEREQKSISDQEQSRVICCPAWLVPGLAVAHKYFGVGEVKTVDEDQFVLFTVSFGKKGDRRFQFPEAFAKGYLYIPQK